MRKIPAGDLKGRVDLVIVTIREDEFNAVVARFGVSAIAEGERDYMIGEAEGYTVAIVRLVVQGNSEAQSGTRDAIHDLDPTWVMVVGIAGGVPDDDFTLGDVVVATHVHEYNVGAVAPTGTEFSNSGGAVAEEINRVTVNISARTELRGWNTIESIGRSRPDVDTDSVETKGPEEWQRKIRQSLKHHFGGAHRDLPTAVTAQIASSDKLIKDPLVLVQWLSTARHIRAVEMETAGAYKAARFRTKTYPVLAIRGISDIVGLSRDAAWTSYACHSAAAFARSFLRLHPLSPRSKASEREPSRASRTNVKSGPHPQVPKIRRPMTALERERLLKQTFESVRDYFRQGIAEAARQDGLDAQLDEPDTHTIEATIVVDGRQPTRCRVWFAAVMGLEKHIYYAENQRGGSTSINDQINLVDTMDPDDLRFKALMQPFTSRRKGLDPNRMTQAQVAEYLWDRFVGHLEFS